MDTVKVHADEHPALWALADEWLGQFDDCLHGDHIYNSTGKCRCGAHRPGETASGGRS